MFCLIVTQSSVMYCMKDILLKCFSSITAFSHPAYIVLLLLLLLLQSYKIANYDTMNLLAQFEWVNTPLWHNSNYANEGVWVRTRFYLWQLLQYHCCITWSIRIYGANCAKWVYLNRYTQLSGLFTTVIFNTLGMFTALGSPMCTFHNQ